MAKTAKPRTTTTAETQPAPVEAPARKPRSRKPAAAAAPDPAPAAAAPEPMDEAALAETHAAARAPVRWTAEIGPNETVIVRHGDAQPPITLDSTTAAQLGIALLAVSVINRGPPQRPPVGTVIENVHFPITHWKVGRSQANSEPMLLATVPGNAMLMLQLTNQAALACGQALVKEGHAADIPLGLKPN